MRAFHAHLPNTSWILRLGYRHQDWEGPSPRDSRSKSGDHGTKHRFPVSWCSNWWHYRLWYGTFFQKIGTNQGACPGQGTHLWSRLTLRQSENLRGCACHHQVIFPHLHYTETLKDSWLKLVPCPPGTPWPLLGGREWSPSMTACF